MLSFVLQNSIFFFVSVTVMVIPGVVVLYFLDKKRQLSFLEYGIFSVGLSFSLALFQGIFLDRLGVPIHIFSLSFLYGIWIIVFVFLMKKKIFFLQKETASLSFIFILIFAIFLLLKGIYFSQNTVPISTDLGHHMYWAQHIIEKGELPLYQEREIIMSSSDTQLHTISQPFGISDLIEGEHVIFAFIAILSQISLLSSAPLFLLFFIHIITALGVYTLTRRIFTSTPFGEKIALGAFVVFGLLFGIDSPQMRYIIGGVVGNTFGYLLIVIIFLGLFIAVMKKSARYMALSIFFMLTLAYTHHLSMFLFAFSLFGIIIFFLAREWRFFWREIFPLLYSRCVLSIILLGVITFFFIWTPAYIVNSGVETIVGDSQQKEEHAGITLYEYAQSLGSERVLFGIFGFFLMFVILFFKIPDAKKQKGIERSLPYILLLGWFLPLGGIVFFPEAFHIDIPTIRTANYTIIPLCISASFFFFWLLDNLLQQSHRKGALVGVVSLLVILFFSAGWRDNIIFFEKKGYAQAKELHRMASYMGKHYRESEKTVMYDHVNITGGSWIKLYFMRDYNYPFYRAHLFRYDRTSDKQERCTLDVFTYPQTTEAEKCFKDLQIELLAINEAKDGKKFRENTDFIRVYSGTELSLYKKITFEK
ncbi:MAG: hypothetical protein EOM19_00050 [Candidatus Moranbacteria bacterium]|nr:hypothetical protein [Candidatus Moranbacteria bacterium]